MKKLFLISLFFAFSTIAFSQYTTFNRIDTCNKVKVTTTAGIVHMIDGSANVIASDANNYTVVIFWQENQKITFDWRTVQSPINGQVFTNRNQLVAILGQYFFFRKRITGGGTGIEVDPIWNAQKGLKADKTTTITIAANSPLISSAGAQNLSANRTWTLSADTSILITKYDSTKMHNWVEAQFLKHGDSTGYFMTPYDSTLLYNYFEAKKLDKSDTIRLAFLDKSNIFTDFNYFQGNIDVNDTLTTNVVYAISKVKLGYTSNSMLKSDNSGDIVAASGGTDYYRPADTISVLETKYNSGAKRDTSDSYSKSTTDNLLNAKPDSGAVGLLATTNIWTKEQTFSDTSRFSKSVNTPMLRSTTGDLNIRTGAANGNILLIPNGTGNVGIDGGGNPLHLFSVCGGNTTNRNIFNYTNFTYNKNRTTISQAQDTSSFSLIYTPLGKPLLKLTGQTGNNIIIVDSTGRFGISGGINPQAPLHVYKDGILSTTNIYAGSTMIAECGTSHSYFNIRCPSNSYGGLMFSDPDATWSGTIDYSHTANFMGFATNGAYYMGLTSTGQLCLGNHTTANYNISFIGTTAKTIGMERATTNPGFNLTINAGGAKSGGTNQPGGILYFKGGITTGTGISGIRLQSAARTASSTSDNVFFDRFIIPSEKVLRDATVDTLFYFTPASADSMFSAVLNYGISATNNTDKQVETGQMFVQGVVKTGTLTGTVTYTGAQALSTGTLIQTAIAIIWNNATKLAYVTVNYDSSLNPTIGNMRMAFSIMNGCRSGITQY